MFVTLHPKIHAQISHLPGEISFTNLLGLVDKRNDYQQGGTVHATEGQEDDYQPDFDIGMPSYQYSDQDIEDENEANMAEDDDEDENEANIAEDDEEVDTVHAPLDSMVFVSHDLEDHISWIENFNANNEDVEFEDPLPDDIEIEHMLHVSQVNPRQFGNVCVEDVITFHVGDLFDTKELLVEAVSEYSLRKGVVYKAVKNNRKNINLVCALHEDVCSDSTIPCNAQCPWKLKAYAGS